MTNLTILLKNSDPVYHKQSSNSLVYYHASFKPFWSVKSRRSVKQYGLKDWQSTLELTSKMGLYKILLCNPQARCNVNKTAIKGITSFNARETIKRYLFWEKKDAVSFHWQILIKKTTITMEDTGSNFEKNDFLPILQSVYNKIPKYHCSFSIVQNE